MLKQVCVGVVLGQVISYEILKLCPCVLVLDAMGALLRCNVCQVENSCS